MNFPGREWRAGFLFCTDADKSKGQIDRETRTFRRIARDHFRVRQSCGKHMAAFHKFVENEVFLSFEPPVSGLVWTRVEHEHRGFTRSSARRHDDAREPRSRSAHVRHGDPSHTRCAGRANARGAVPLNAMRGRACWRETIGGCDRAGVDDDEPCGSISVAPATPGR